VKPLLQSSSIPAARRGRRCVVALALALSLLAPSMPLAAADTPPPSEEDLECVMMPHSVLDLSSGVSGRLKSVAVDRADPVRAGEMLAELETEVERASRDLAAERAGMRSEVNLRAAGLDFDRRRHRRLDTLHASSVVSDQDRELAERDMTLSRWQLELARDKLRLADLELRRSEALLALRSVRSPFDGVVLERFKSPGEYVDEEPVLRVARMDPLRIEVIVPIALHTQARAAGSADVYSELDPDTPHRARMVAIDPMGDPASGTFRARLELPNPGNRLLAGVRCSARLVMAEDETHPEPAQDAPAEAPPVPAAFEAAPVRDALEASPFSDAPVREAVREVQGAPEPVDAPADAAAEAIEAVAEAPGQPPGHTLDNDSEQAVHEEAFAQTCRTIGPFSQRGVARRVATQLTEGGMSARVRADGARATDGYLILAIPTDPAESPQALDARLREAGVRDLAHLPRGPYAGHVSLGVYRGPKHAGRRVEQLAERGVQAEQVPRLNGSATWWLDVEVPEPAVADTLTGAVIQVDPTLRVQPAPCSPLQTAAR
jgi:RND family efflux transporter MFP subunit